MGALIWVLVLMHDTFVTQQVGKRMWVEQQQWQLMIKVQTSLLSGRWQTSQSLYPSVTWREKKTREHGSKRFSSSTAAFLCITTCYFQQVAPPFNHPITWRQLNAFRCVHTVESTCCSSNRASPSQSSVVKWLWTWQSQTGWKLLICWDFPRTAIFTEDGLKKRVKNASCMSECIELMGRHQLLKYLLVTTKVCRGASPNAQQVEPWNRRPHWVSPLRTGNRGYSTQRLSKTGAWVMSVSFCCDIGSELKTTWKHGSIRPCVDDSDWLWCNGAKDIFLSGFGPRA